MRGSLSKVASSGAGQGIYHSHSRGARVDYVGCYRRAAPQADVRGLVECLRTGQAHALTLTSVEGLANLLDAIGPRGQAWCARLKTFAPHPRIVAAARDAGLDAIETPPGDAGLLTALLEWFTQHPVPPSSP